jgi:hypothetical protein
VLLNKAEGTNKEMAGNENEANKIKRESGPETVVNIGQYAQNYQRQTQVKAVTYEPNIKLHKPLLFKDGKDRLKKPVSCLTRGDRQTGEPVFPAGSGKFPVNKGPMLLGKLLFPIRNLLALVGNASFPMSER